jgi:hypothetical protein
VYGRDTGTDVSAVGILTKKLQRGRWMILRSEHNPIHGLFHQCDPHDGDDSSKMLATVKFCIERDSIYVDRVKTFRKAKWRCECCWKTPPETILGAYLLLEADKTSAEIQAVL